MARSLCLFLLVLSSLSAHLIESDQMILSLSRQNLYFLHGFPSARVSFADDDGDGRISLREYQEHGESLRSFLASRVRLIVNQQERDWDDFRLQFSPDHDDETQASVMTIASALAKVLPSDSITLVYDLWIEGDRDSHIDVAVRVRQADDQVSESRKQLSAPQNRLVCQP